MRNFLPVHGKSTETFVVFDLWSAVGVTHGTYSVQYILPCATRASLLMVLHKEHRSTVGEGR
jgi:hypothetical protein